MQAIITKFYGPTNTKGARIKAECAAGSVYVPYSYEFNTQDEHWQAAKALIVKMGWQDWKDTKGESSWVCGGTPDGKGFVFVNDGIRSDVYSI